MPTIDQICDDFESDWREGKSPVVEDYVNKAASDDRVQLRIQLTTLSNELSQAQFPVTDYVGPYKILQKVGEGGMGSVWLAEQREPVRRRVAIKLVRSEKNTPEIRARFDAERQALAIMNHPNIAKVLDAGTNEHRPYYVMELIEGLPLNEYCDVNRLTVEARLRLFIQLCGAVEHVHRKGVIHRDLKPANVMVGSIDDQPVLKLIDFGLAKAGAHQFKLTEQTLVTEYGQVLGTLRYISPEQAELNPLNVDQRSDIYSLGAMLYELLSGSTPLDDSVFDKSGRLKILELIQNFETPRPSQRLYDSAENESSLSLEKVSQKRRVGPKKLVSLLRNSGLDWVCLKALDRDPNRRYPSAAEFRKDIERFLDNKPVSAGPPSMGVRFSRFMSRNRKLLTSVAAGVLLVVAAVTGTLWLADSPIDNEQTERYSNYVSDVRQTWMEWQNDDVNSAWRVFAEIDRELAGWEVGYIHTEFSLNQTSFYAHKSGINALAMNNEKTLLATGAYDEKILIHEYPAMDLKVQFKLKNVTGLDFSPDGKTVVAGTHTGNVHLWNIESGEEVWTAQNDNNLCVKFSPDGTMVGIGNNNGNVLVRDAKTGQRVTMYPAHPGPANSICWFADNKRILSCGFDGMFMVRNIEDNKTDLQVNGLDEQLQFAVLSPDEKLVAVTGFDGRINVFDLPAGILVHQLRGHRTAVEVLHFDPSGDLLISGGGGRFDKKDCSIRIWDVADGKQVGICRGHANSVRGIEIDSRDRIVSVSFDTVIKIWDIDFASRRNQSYKTGQPITSFELSEDDKTICFSSFDNTTRFAKLGEKTASALTDDIAFDGHRPTPHPASWFSMFARIYRVEPSKNGLVTGAAFLEDGQKIVTVGSDNQIVIHSLDGPDVKSVLTFEKTSPDARDGVWSIVVTPDDKLVIAACNDGKLRVCDVSTLELSHEFSGSLFDVMRMEISPDGEKLAAGGKDGMLGLWEIESGKTLWISKVHPDYVASVKFSRDGKQLFSGGAEGDLYVSDSTDGKQILSFAGHTGTVTALEIDVTGTRLFSAASDEVVRVWDISTGNELLRIPTPSGSIVTCMAFNKTCSRLILSTTNGEILSIQNDRPLGNVPSSDGTEDVVVE